MSFQLDGNGQLSNCAANVDKLRTLWLDRSVIDGDLLGPGDPGDFDHGAWHVSCHLVAAGSVLRGGDGRLLWMEISHDAERDVYYPSVTMGGTDAPRTIGLDSDEAQEVVANAALLGFVEGNSTGRISARGVSDPTYSFNNNPRQDYDEPTSSSAEGGKVWEHWCTLRDLRRASTLATSVLRSYVAMVSYLGDSFAAIVARGRHEYYHPRQLCALISAGFISRDAATLEMTPTVIPESAETLFLETSPAESVRAAEKLDWYAPIRYYMFRRKIGSWVAATTIEELLAKHC